jgi:hypothetical protein
MDAVLIVVSLSFLFPGLVFTCYKSTMQLGLFFTALLASILTIFPAVDAAPFRRTPRAISLPLENSPGLRSDIPTDVVSWSHAI